MGFKFNPFTGTLDIVDTSKAQSFTWSRSGNIPKNTYLMFEDVPSNKSGAIISMQGVTIRKVFSANEDPVVIVLEIYTHDGDENALALIGTVTTLAQRSNFFDVAFSVPTGKQVAIKTKNITGNNAKNINVGLVVDGELL